MTEISATQTEVAGSKVVRSGLERSLGAFGTVAIAVAAISLTYSGLLPFSDLAGLFPASNLMSIILVAVGLCFLHSLTYVVIGTVAPRAGADYVLTSRVIHPSIAFASSFVFVVFAGLFIGTILAQLPQTIIPVFLKTFGMVLKNTTLLNLASMAGSPQGIIIIGTVILIMAFWTMNVSQKILQRIFQMGLILGIGAWVILFVQLAAPVSFPAAWDQFMGPGSFAAQVPQAAQMGMKINLSPELILLAALVIGTWAFQGGQGATMIAGEVRRTGRNLLISAFVSLLVSGAILAGASFLVGRLASPDWLSAESFLMASGVKESMPWVTFYAAIMYPSIVLMAFVGLAWIYTTINLAQAFLLFGSRIIYAWSKDKLIPSWIGMVQPKLRTPMIAVLILGIIAEFGIADAARGGSFNYNLDFAIFAVIPQVLPVLAVLMFPFVKREWFLKAPRLVRLRIGPLPLVCVLSLYSLAFLAAIPVVFFYVAGSDVSSLIFELVLAVGIFLVGVIWYILRSNYLRRHSVWPGKIFMELPEE